MIELLPCCRDMMTSSNDNIFRVRDFVWGIHRSPVNSHHKGQWRGVVIFFLWSAPRINNREAGDLGRHRAHYDVIVRITLKYFSVSSTLQGKSANGQWLPLTKCQQCRAYIFPLMPFRRNCWTDSRIVGDLGLWYRVIAIKNNVTSKCVSLAFATISPVALAITWCQLRKWI